MSQASHLSSTGERWYFMDVFWNTIRVKPLLFFTEKIICVYPGNAGMEHSEIIQVTTAHYYRNS